VGPTRQSHGPNRAARAASSAFRQQRTLPCLPMASPTISTTVSATVPAHHFRRPRPPPHAAFKRSAPPESSPFLLLLLLPSPYSPCHSPLPPLHPTLTPLSAHATLLSINTVLKRRFHLEAAAMKSLRSNPTLCAVSTEGTSLMAAIFGHRPHSFSPPRGPHRRLEPLRPTSRRRRPHVWTTTAVPLRPT
jgi:hypothetical protein